MKIKFASALLGVVLLSGCGANIDDLVAYTNQVRANTQVSIKDLPEFQPLEAVEYEVADLRSPFLRSQRQQATQSVVKMPNCEQPNNNRRKQKLENYGLDALSMSGVFTSNGRKFALISANDGSLHRVSIGNYIGLFHGRITSISSTQITIKEMLPDGTGCWKSKTANLSMSGVTGDDNNV